MFSHSLTTAQLIEQYDLLIEKGINRVRLDIPDYQDTTKLAVSKTAVQIAVNRGLQVVWGVSSNSFNGYTITATNLPDLQQAWLDNALWAQNNGVFEYQVGNEEELHHDETLTDLQVRDAIRQSSTAVQAIFTRGPVSTAVSSGSNGASAWISDANLGDLDAIGLNIYVSSAPYGQGMLSSFMTAFGSDKAYVSEFNISGASLDTYSTNEDIQAVRTAQLIDEIRDIGYKRAYYFCFVNSQWGAIKTHGGQARILWNVLTTGGGRRWFINI